jgi:hypothetical protein
MSAKKPRRNGKAVSPVIGPHSKIEIKWPSPELKRLLGSVYNQFQKLDDPAANRRSREDFVFHMTDWLNDLDLLWNVYQHPNNTGKDAAGDAVFGFLIHAVPHLMAAGRLLLGEISDPFAEMKPGN